MPLLPTTPFLLLAAALWVRSSPRLYVWLLSHRRLGPYIRNFRENRAIPLRAKILSVTLLWATLLYCIFFVVEEWWGSTRSGGRQWERVAPQTVRGMPGSVFRTPPRSKVKPSIRAAVASQVLFSPFRTM